MLRSIEQKLIRAEEHVLVGIVLFMVFLSFLQVVLRVFLGRGLLWADTLLRHLVLWVGFLGACLAASANKQFAMDAVDRVAKGPARKAIHLTGALFSAAISILLLQASITFFREEFSNSKTLFSAFGWEVPEWPFEIILPIGFFLLGAHYLIRSMRIATEPSLPEGTSQ